MGGLEQVLRDHNRFEVVGTSTSGLEAIGLARKLSPDLMVLDYAMPDVNGLDVFLEVSRWSPDTKTALVTGTSNTKLLHRLRDAGVHGLFQKSSDPTLLCAGFLRILAGECVTCPATAAQMREPHASANLSHREIEVLNCIADGLTNAKSAERLNISPKTVDSHRTALMRKLGVNSTASLLIRAVREGLIDIGN